ncbi:winged helix-turn-helix domain-containing protein [Citrobacter koseri]|uniref:winged helix-turn-helix domain-containing protein n=1 Tax=Citrobacter koseri TaxID=545 RepID=UPI000AC963A1|nr:hypothetical protein [Citrobacter koseri]HEM6801147.1 hypothetical protein [Citrobacter koseri]
MEKKLFGFQINNDIQFDIAQKRLIRISVTNSVHSMAWGVVYLSDPMVRFLACLLIRKDNGENIVSKKTVLKEVWEDHGLISSSQLLWKTVRELNIRLASIGLLDFVINVTGTGYSLVDYVIVPLFYSKNQIN